MYDAVPPKLKRTLVKCWDFLAVNHSIGKVPWARSSTEACLADGLYRCFRSFLRSTFATTASCPSPCIFLALQERSFRPRIQLLRSPFVAFAWLGAHYLDLHVGQERSHRPQSREHRGDERHDASHRNARRQRYLQEHLVVLVADDQAPDVPLRNQLLGTVD